MWIHVKFGVKKKEKKNFFKPKLYIKEIIVKSEKIIVIFLFSSSFKICILKNI